MKTILLILAVLLVSPVASANFIFQYGLNYSSQEIAGDSESTNSRTFHKILLGASINRNRTLFFGYNINSWSSAVSSGGGDEDTYSVLEMGPRLIWFMNEELNWYFSLEWNPYAKGSRDVAGESQDIDGSSTDFALGYRFKVSRLVGLGAGIHYHSYSVDESKVNNTSADVSDKVTNIMPMLELTIITR